MAGELTTNGLARGLGIVLSQGGGSIAVNFTPMALVEGAGGQQTLTADKTATWSVDDDGGTGATINAATGQLSVPAQSYYRDMFLYPFTAKSIWNVPLADGAVYQPGQGLNETAILRLSDPYSDGGLANAYGSIAASMFCYKGTPDDPLVNWTYQGRPQFLDWPHPEDTGTYYGGGSFMLPTPLSFNPLTVDGWAIIELADGSYYESYRPTLTYDGSGKLTRVACTFVARNVLYDIGFPNNPATPDRHDGIRAVGMSLLGGLVRTDEVASGRIPHALAMIISGYQAKAAVGGDKYSQVMWPAYHPDNGSLTAYIGNIPMGALFAIPWSVDIDRIGIKTAEGRMLARALQEYGGYCVDTSTTPPVGAGGGGTFALAALEATMPASAITNMQTDMDLIRNYLSWVSNNATAASAAAISGAPQPVGGGGNPRIPASRTPTGQQTTNPRLVKVKASAGAISKTVVVPVTVGEIETIAPVIRNPATFRIPEKARAFIPLLGNEKAVWSIVGGADQASFEVVNDPIAGSYLRFASNGIKAGAQTLVVQVCATDVFGNLTNQTITVSVVGSNDYGNILLNPTWATGDLTDWVESIENSAGVASVSGSKLRLTTDGTPVKNVSRVLQRIAVIPGRTYQLKGTINHTGLSGTAANVHVSNDTRGRNLINYRTGTGAFTITFSSTLPYVYIICVLNNYGTPANAGYVEWNGLELLDTVDLYAPTYVKPDTLFQRGELGAWYDASDLSTMLQDSSGTVVSGTGQIVGRLFSKLGWQGSLSASLSVTLIQNGDFAANSLTPGWTGTSWDASTGKATKTAGDTNQLTATLTQAMSAGNFYEIKWTMSGASGGSMLVRTQSPTSVTLANSGTNGTRVFYPVLSGAAGALNFVPGASAFVGSIDDVSIKQVPGRHAYQETASLKPLWTTGGWLAFDGVDDAMSVNFASALGAACTIVYVAADGAHVLQNQTVGTTYALPSDGNKLYQLVIINRALIPQEITSVRADLLARAGM